MFLEPALSHFNWGEATYQVGITLGLAFLSTDYRCDHCFFSFFDGCNKFISCMGIGIVRIFVAITRAVPTVLWVLIFAIAAGLGSEAAILGMLFHSIAYLVKAFSEAFEEVDKGIFRGAASNWCQLVAYREKWC